METVKFCSYAFFLWSLFSAIYYLCFCVWLKFAFSVVCMICRNIISVCIFSHLWLMFTYQILIEGWMLATRDSLLQTRAVRRRRRRHFADAAAADCN